MMGMMGPEYGLQIKTNENNASKYTYPSIMVVDFPVDAGWEDIEG